MIPALVSVSRAPVGSSAHTIAGLVASALAIVKRWRWPPLISAGRWRAHSPTPTISTASCARLRALDGLTPPTSIGSSTFSIPVRTGSKL